ncbi:MAG TPA: ABC transporter ATP-binding protein [Planctomycetota bacterium]|nr:ABC transporter ATP-binding protein [Planctomycetota bacterium]
MIDVHALCKIFHTHQGQEQKAVDGLSFKVARGEIYGLLGPNGAGKTTTLRMLAGLMQPTSGEVSIDGAPGSSDPQALKLRTGFLTAKVGLYSRLTPRETLTYFGELRGIPPEELRQQVDELIRLLSLTPFADRRCDGFSTGESQRVQIARTLVGNPPVLILDEPTNGLDVLSNRLILNFVRQAAKDGRTIIISTHHLDEVETLCHRFGLIHKGKMLAEGTIGHLRELSGKERLSDIFLELVERVEGRAPTDGVGPVLIDPPAGVDATSLATVGAANEGGADVIS